MYSLYAFMGSPFVLWPRASRPRGAVIFLLAGQNFLTVPQVIGPVLVLDALAAAAGGVDPGVGAVVGQRPPAVLFGRGALVAFLAAGDAEQFVPLPAFAAVSASISSLMQSGMGRQSNLCYISRLASCFTVVRALWR